MEVRARGAKSLSQRDWSTLVTVGLQAPVSGFSLCVCLRCAAVVPHGYAICDTMLLTGQSYHRPPLGMNSRYPRSTFNYIKPNAVANVGKNIIETFFPQRSM